MQNAGLQIGLEKSSGSRYLFKSSHTAVICVHLSLSPFCCYSNTHFGRTWGKEAIEFFFHWWLRNQKKFRATVLASISCRH